MATALHILFEDNHCLVVEKPARLLSASDGTDSETMFTCVKAYVNASKTEGKQAYLAPLHFLDRPVSGLMIYAKSSKAAARLNVQFKNHRIQKTYLCVVEGRPQPPAATLEHYLSKNSRTNITSACLSKDNAEAKYCRLDYRVIANYEHLSLLEVKPVTGRSHQIRVQLSTCGWPIFGDIKYKSKHGLEGKILLHAWRLTFEHPTLKTMMSFTVNPPIDWSQIWPDITQKFGNQP